MHLHALRRRWLDHPFWRTRSCIDDAGRPARRCAPAASPNAGSTSARACDVAAERRPTCRRRGAPAAAAAPVAAPACRRAPPPARRDSTRNCSAGRRGRASAAREAVTSMFSEARLGRALDAESCLPLVDEIAASVFRNPGALVSLARLKTHDDYTYMHSVAVCALMVSLGRQLGLDEAACREAGLAGLLHDLGKALMPLDVLNKPGKLTDDEFGDDEDAPRARPRAAASKAARAARRARRLPAPPREVRRQRLPARPAGRADHAAGAHGRGLRRLRRDHLEPALQGRLGPGRIDRARWPRGSGHFDDDRVRRPSCRAWASTRPARWCACDSGRLAWSSSRAARTLVAPVVKVFFSTKSNMPMPPETVDLAAAALRPSIVAREPVERWEFPHLDELWAAARDAAPARPHLNLASTAGPHRPETCSPRFSLTGQQVGAALHLPTFRRPFDPLQELR